jgi:hypothetical protein
VLDIHEGLQAHHRVKIHRRLLQEPTNRLRSAKARKKRFRSRVRSAGFGGEQTEQFPQTSLSDDSIDGSLDEGARFAALQAELNQPHCIWQMSVVVSVNILDRRGPGRQVLQRLAVVARSRILEAPLVHQTTDLLA